MSALGFIGLGVMGQPMALNLCKAGQRLNVFARNPAQSAPLREAGAAVLDSPVAVAKASAILFVNVSDDAALEAVLFGPDGAANGLAASAIVVDMGTTSPTYTRHLASRLGERGIELIDAPVSGGEAGAIAGTLSIMAGGTEAAFQRVLPLFQAIGGNIVHVGASGAGQIAKACNQIVVSAALLGVAEALTFAARQGVDAGKVRQALLGGSAYSKILEIHGQRMLERNFKPGFKARLHQKDLGIVLAEAQQAGMALPATALAAQLMNALVGSGGGEQDSAALVEMLEQLNRITP
ncbi:MAG: 2-hydroxy-3-oxopropionate reductase [Hydrogenophilales bacterium 28-61-23]|nr:MAG: 2-hydroxy-3-oxopropionate reductase [Hydrogenophilales bacterium 28-61-23]